MFKSILPSRRIVSSEFTMVTAEPDEPAFAKENYPTLAATARSVNVPKTRNEKSKKSKGKQQPVDGVVTDQDFDQLLDELQIPPTLRPKLATMEPSVKAAMLKSSYTLARGKQPQVTTTTAINVTPHGLRRAHSSGSFSLTRSQDNYTLENIDAFQPSALTPPSFPPATTGHSRGVSLGMNRSMANLTLPRESLAGPTKKSAHSSAKYCSILAGTSSTQLEVETVKKLRLLLRNESASWSQEFLQQGGYGALLTRLNEILEVEWREEQHDDQMLHELLRCVKGLTTSTIGCDAVRSYCPAPFQQLVSLLYSDKKPGDVGTRQLIVELLQILFDLYPASALPGAGSSMSSSHKRARSVPWGKEPAGNVITLPSHHASVFSLVQELLLTPAPPPSESPRTPIEPHDFIEGLHRPRIYKSYLQELSDICRDYFWVFCHPNNTVWNLAETDEGKVERPRAPGGMTGGVEFEAMSYLTSHFKFLNALAKSAEDLKLPVQHEHSAYRFHTDMFLSGMERILLIARKASTTYYPTLHLEISRYLAAALRAGYDIPWSLSRMVGPPPQAMRKPSSAKSSRAYAQTGLGREAGAHTSPAERGGDVRSPPVLPSPRKVTPMFG